MLHRKALDTVEKRSTPQETYNTGGNVQHKWNKHSSAIIQQPTQNTPKRNDPRQNAPSQSTQNHGKTFNTVESINTIENVQHRRKGTRRPPTLRNPRQTHLHTTTQDKLFRRKAHNTVETFNTVGNIQHRRKRCTPWNKRSSANFQVQPTQNTTNRNDQIQDCSAAKHPTL